MNRINPIPLFSAYETRTMIFHYVWPNTPLVNYSWTWKFLATQRARKHILTYRSTTAYRDGSARCTGDKYGCVRRITHGPPDGSRRDGSGMHCHRPSRGRYAYSVSTWPGRAKSAPHVYLTGFAGVISSSCLPLPCHAPGAIDRRLE